MSAHKENGHHKGFPSVVINGSDPARIPFSRTPISPEAQDAVARVLASGWVTTGPETAEFEKEFGDFVSAPYAVAVSSCTAAIEISLRALDLPRGAKVATSAITFCGAVHAIIHAGLRPVLVDVDPETIMPNADTTAAAARRVGGLDAMVALHFAGHPAPVEEMADAAGLPMDRVIEDAAHAVGTRVGDRPVGSISAATCFSFYATKNLPIGEGGMITTADPGIADFARRVRLHGMSLEAWKRYMPGSPWRYSVDAAGMKANMTDIQAGIGRAQLAHFEGWQEQRRRLVDRYTRNLASVDGIRTPPRPADGEHAWHLFVVRVEPSFGITRDELFARLAERGVDCSVHFIPTHHHSYFRQILEPDAIAGLDVADAVFHRIVSLPLYPSLTDADVDRVCAEIADLQESEMDLAGMELDDRFNCSSSELRRATR